MKPDLWEVSDVDESRHSKRYEKNLVEEEKSLNNQPEDVEVNNMRILIPFNLYIAPKPFIHHKKDSSSGQFLMKSASLNQR